MDQPEAPQADLTNFHPDRPLDELRKSVFMIRTERGTGTGFLIDDKTIATDYHVIRDTRNIRAIGHDGREYRLGEHVAYDNKNDLAVLTIVDEAPKDAKPLSLAPATTLLPGEGLYSLGHGRGGPARWYSGTFNNMTTHRDWLTHEAANADRFERIRSDMALRQRDPALLNLPLAYGDIPVTNGCSGGPIFNSHGEVVSIVRLGVSKDPTREYASPAEQLKTLYDGRYDGTQFGLRNGHREMGIVSWGLAAERDPVSFTAGNAAMFFAARGGVRLAGFSTDPMCLISQGSALRNGAFFGTVVGIRTMMDGAGLLNAHDRYDTTKYSLALASDGIMAGGIGTSMWGALRNGGAGRYGKMLMLGGAVGRLACEFIPNNYRVDIGKEIVYP